MIKLSDAHAYDAGYITLDIPIPDGLPESVDVNGQKLLLKSEFHISLINAKAIAELIDETNKDRIEAEIVEEFKEFIKEYPLDQYKLLNQFRFVQRDIRKTLIILAEVPNLNKFFERIRSKYKKKIPDQPTHITIYTLQPEKGIGILSEDSLNSESESVEVPELEKSAFISLAPEL